MPKDPTKNVDRYKIRGGQLNAFEFHQNQGAVSEQQHEQENWMGATENGADMPPDKAKAERVRQLLAEHGEAMPQTNHNQPEGDEMAQSQSDEQGGRRQTKAQPATASQNNDQMNTANADERGFEPTHGRSPEVIREMMESRRRNDRVPDPEDILAGHPEQSEEKKEHGQTGRGTGTRRTNKQTAAPKSAAASPSNSAPRYSKATKGKEAALDRSKPGVATGTNEKKEAKQASSQQAAAGRGMKQSAKSGGATQATARASAKPSTTSKGNAQANGRKDSAGKAAGGGASKSAGARSAQARPSANGKAASRTTQTGGATTGRSKAPAGRGR